MGGQHACLIQGEPSFARHLQQVVHQFTPKCRTKHATAIPCSKDHVVTQIKHRMRGPERSRLIAAMPKGGRTQPCAVAMMLGLRARYCFTA